MEAEDEFELEDTKTVGGLKQEGMNWVLQTFLQLVGNFSLAISEVSWRTNPHDHGFEYLDFTIGGQAIGVKFNEDHLEDCLSDKVLQTEIEVRCERLLKFLPNFRSTVHHLQVDLDEVFREAIALNDIHHGFRRLHHWQERASAELEQVGVLDGAKEFPIIPAGNVAESQMTKYALQSEIERNKRALRALMRKVLIDLDSYAKEFDSRRRQFNTVRPFVSSEAVVPENVQDLLRLTREGIFFAGQYFDALMYVAKILSQARRSIVIIDGYISENVLNLLTAKRPGVEVKILTKSVSPAVRTTAHAFNRQYRNLSIRTSQAFHDRFVIIDEADFYHFGASIKDLGHRGFMFSRIEEPEVINALRVKLVQEWQAAQSEV